MAEILPDGTTKTTVKRNTGRAWLALRDRVIAEETHCYLCGLEVDKSLKRPDPMSPSADHIIPVALGGAEMDRANVSLTHLTCNLSRGTKPVDEVRYTPYSQDW